MTCVDPPSTDYTKVVRIENSLTEIHAKENAVSPQYQVVGSRTFYGGREAWSTTGLTAEKAGIVYTAVYI